MRKHSPYNYAFNNPIRFIDPDGMMAFSSEAIRNAANGIDIEDNLDRYHNWNNESNDDRKPAYMDYHRAISNV